VDFFGLIFFWRQTALRRISFVKSFCVKSLASVIENFVAAPAMVIGFVILTQLAGHDENFSRSAPLIDRSCAENRKAS
jgi:hypothetical protein